MLFTSACLSGSEVLERWQRLAQPRLDGICERRFGIQNCGEKASDSAEVGSEVFDLDDCEEDGTSKRSTRRCDAVTGAVTSRASVYCTCGCPQCSVVPVVCCCCVKLTSQSTKHRHNDLSPHRHNISPSQHCHCYNNNISSPLPHINNSYDSGIDSDVTPSPRDQQHHVTSQASALGGLKLSVNLCELVRKQLGFDDDGSDDVTENEENDETGLDVALGRNVWLDSDFVLYQL